MDPRSSIQAAHQRDNSDKNEKTHIHHRIRMDNIDNRNLENDHGFYRNIFLRHREDIFVHRRIADYFETDRNVHGNQRI